MKVRFSNKAIFFICFLFLHGLATVSYSENNGETAMDQRTLSDSPNLDEGENLNENSMKSKSEEASLNNENAFTEEVLGATASESVDSSLNRFYTSFQQKLSVMVSSKTQENFAQAIRLTFLLFFSIMFSMFLSFKPRMHESFFSRFYFKLKYYYKNHFSSRSLFSLKASFSSQASTSERSVKDSNQQNVEEDLTNPIVEDNLPEENNASGDSPIVENAPTTNTPVLINNPPDVEAMEKPSLTDPNEPKNSPDPDMPEMIHTTIIEQNMSANLQANVVLFNATSINTIANDPESEEDDALTIPVEEPVDIEEDAVVTSPSPTINDEEKTENINTPNEETLNNLEEDLPPTMETDKNDLNTPVIDDGKSTPSNEPNTPVIEDGKSTPLTYSNTPVIDDGKSTPPTEELPQTPTEDPVVVETIKEDVNDPSETPSPIVNSDSNVNSDPDVTEEERTDGGSPASNPSFSDSYTLLTFDANANVNVDTRITQKTVYPGYEDSTNYQNYEPQNFQNEWFVESNSPVEETLDARTDSVSGNTLIDDDPSSDTALTSNRRLGSVDNQIIASIDSSSDESTAEGMLIELQEMSDASIFDEKGSTQSISGKFSIQSKFKVLGSFLGSTMQWILNNLLSTFLFFLTVLASIVAFFIDKPKKNKNFGEF